MTRHATLDAPVLLPLAGGGWAVVADDAGLWCPRLGDVARASTPGAGRWSAWPLDRPRVGGFATRREAVAHVVSAARERNVKA
jgi:hypothetical protein